MVPRQMFRRVPPNVPKDIRAAEEPVGSGATPGAYGPLPSGPGGLAVQPQIVFPPWVYPPGYASRYFFPNDELTLAAGPSTTLLPGTLFNIPQSNVGVIRSLTFAVNNMVITSDITFRLLFNGAPVEGHDNIRIFPRAAASVSVSFGADETTIFVPEGTQVQVQATVVDAIAYQVGASYRGWFYSKLLASRFPFPV